MPDERTRILVATDRQSAFDRMWCTIPLKGQVLTQLSAWWFTQVQDVMPTHLIEVPDPNVMACKNLQMLKVEVVVRAYLTGSTVTSVWHHYQNGGRNMCGNALPDGMVRNQKLKEPILTPTTKGEEDELIDSEGIVERGLATQEQWEKITDRALALFQRGQEVAAGRGLILVDTKYEMGIDENGVLTIADEVHTPDSSRYWVAATYDDRFSRGEEPESLDKEFFRLWLRGQGFNPSDHAKPVPVITDEVRVMLAGKYIDLYERMTGGTFVFPAEANTTSRIEKNLAKYHKK